MNASRCAAALSLVMSMAAWPQHAAAGEDACLQGLLFSIENDYLGRGRFNTDRWYTNGLHAAWSYRRDEACTGPGTRAARALGNVVTPLGGDLPDAPDIYFGFGQNIYTPQDITIAEPQPDDRPWAGYLYGVVGSAAERGGGRHEAVELKLGLVGPASQAAGLQRWFHDKVIHDDEPRGWPNQLRPRLAAQLNYTFTQRWTDIGLLPDWAGVHGHLRASLGRPRTLAALGLTLVAGEKERVFGAPDEGDHLGLDFREHANHLPGLLHRLTVYAQAQVAGVAYNQFISGTSFGPQSEVKPRRAVVMTTLGFSWRTGGTSRLEYRVKWRSRDFEPPADAPTDRVQRYGELRWVVDTSR
ncbi:MAG TPA: lipid A deacylase LpxR family protein [Methylibium sp.]|uniref:lipid A deacylase LpxR family protein n=1 Tax=Methylibium sp. TaxID=2067992 RepID=UPI002DBC9B61|nr:lipid A deacylase LpxR family protein [Methylibium sp.]HEU4458084.1 lipid A deacylase LpxR family protein [Methylibium sp.]